MDNVSDFKEHQLADILRWSLPILLRYEDRNSMAHSVETRQPFVDYRLIEYCLSLPENLFFRNGKPKRLLAEACAPYLPQLILNRRDKMGFDTPEPVWMRGQMGNYLLERICSSTTMAELVDINKVSDAYKLYFENGKGINPNLAFRLGILAIWLDVFRITL
jgi:asparagine synthase (glutamine-hydrolysing)